MDDTKKMLRVIINGQSVMKSELLGEINKLRKETNKGFEEVDKKMTTLEKNLTNRIDRLGKSIAYLEDDTPTREEYDSLEKRVSKVEHKIASA